MEDVGQLLSLKDHENSDEDCSNGLESSYLHLVNGIEKFKKIYQDREALLKGNLSKLNTEKMTRKKLDEDVSMLKQKANTTIDRINQQSNMINSLISNAFNYSDRYISLRQTIDSVCFFSFFYWKKYLFN